MEEPQATQIENMSWEDDFAGLPVDQAPPPPQQPPPSPPKQQKLRKAKVRPRPRGRGRAEQGDANQTPTQKIQYGCVLRLSGPSRDVPLLLPIHSYSFGASHWGFGRGRGLGLGSRRARHPSRRGAQSVYEWSREDVITWLKREGFAIPSMLELVDKEDITGAGLLELTEEDLKEAGVGTLGFRARLCKALDRLKVPRVVEQDLVHKLTASLRYNVVVDQTLLELQKAEGLMEAAITVYNCKKIRGRRKHLQDAFPEGEALLQYTLQRAVVQGCSYSGSQGNLDRKSISLTLVYEGLLIQRLVTQQDAERFGLDLDWSTTATRAGLATYVAQYAKDKSWQQQWRSGIHWTPHTHRFFPREFRDAVRTLLLIRARPGTALHPLPLDATMQLLRSLSCAWAPTNPSFYPYPFVLASDA